MTLNNVKKLLEEITSTYFSGGAVIWGQAKAVRPISPVVTLNAGAVMRNFDPITLSVDGVPVNVYPSQTTVQVDIFTRGVKAIDEVPGVYSASINTAVNDMIEFMNFLNSEYVASWCYVNDISITISGPVNDLTALINDTAWDYRAMVELEIGFTQGASGSTGMNWEGGVGLDEFGNPLPPLTDSDGNPILDDDGNPMFAPFAPNPSGGGSASLADESTGWFEQVDIERGEDL